MPNRAEIYKEHIYPKARSLGAEEAHDLAINLLHLAEKNPLTLKILERTLAYQGTRYESQRLNLQVGGVELENPLVVAAGFDKNGKAVKSLYTLGFSSVVVGTVLKHPQEGNPKPRIHRTPNESLINSMGFPSEGVARVKGNLQQYRNRSFPLGVSIGINKDIDHGKASAAYAHVAKELSESADYFEINVSSPNTKGLRDLQAKNQLEDIVSKIKSVSQNPLFVKVSPDLTTTQLDDVIQVAVDHNLAIVATNTSSNQEIKRGLGEKWESVAGGVSGSAIEELSNRSIRHITRNSNVEVVGAGGVQDVDSAVRKLDSGAKCLQVYTGFVYEGPDFPSRLNSQMDEKFNSMG